VATEKVRLRITQAAACPALSELGLFAEPQEAALKRYALPVVPQPLLIRKKE
jgi:hypothetical protein